MSGGKVWEGGVEDTAQHDGDGSSRESKARAGPCITPRAELTSGGRHPNLRGGSATLINKRGPRLMQGEPRVFPCTEHCSKTHVKINVLTLWNDKGPRSVNFMVYQFQCILHGVEGLY